MGRQMVGLRLSEGGLGQVDKIAEDTGAVRAVVIRTLLGEALRNTTVKNAAIDKLNAMRETI